MELLVGVATDAVFFDGSVVARAMNPDVVVVGKVVDFTVVVHDMTGDSR